MKRSLIAVVVLLGSGLALAQGPAGKKGSAGQDTAPEASAPAQEKKKAEPARPQPPDVSRMPFSPDSIRTVMTYYARDIQECYERWSAKGAEFVTPPIDRGAEIRCYMRDPDGYMIEVGQATGLLEGRLAEKRPEDLPG